MLLGGLKRARVLLITLPLNGLGVGNGRGFKMKKLKFYDLKAKRSFKTDKYAIRVKKGRRFAVATAPSGISAWRILK